MGWLSRFMAANYIPASGTETYRSNSRQERSIDRRTQTEGDRQVLRILGRHGETSASGGPGGCGDRFVRSECAGHIGPEGEPQLTVHEWGTFTSIAGPDGQAVEWRPLTGPSDLPCFVTTLNPNSIKINAQGGIPGLKALVRMETPVLYFYSPVGNDGSRLRRISARPVLRVVSAGSVSMAQVATRAVAWQIKWADD